MTSKINPGKFNCYTAAMPDEPIFTILGRDPAFPATVLFWRDERARQGKNVSDDDIDRLVTALGEAAGAASWRVQNLEGPDGRPTWQTRMSFVTDDTNPICIDKDSTPRYLNQDEVISDMRELLDKFENGVIYNDYDRTVELLGTLQTVVKDMERPVETNTYNGPAEDDFRPPVAETVVSGFVRIDGRDYDVKHLAGELKALERFRTYVGTGQDESALKVGTGIRQVCQDLNRKGVTLIPALREWMFTIVDRLGGYAMELGVPPLTVPVDDAESGSSLLDIPLSPGGTVGRHNRASYDRPVRDRGYTVPVVGMEFMNEDDLTPGEKLVINSEPEDLAHNPEVPQHRFAMFNKGENYAYARGLEINPSFLPVALDAMHKDGWELVSLFGQTNSEHVGFVFKRIVPPAVIVQSFDFDETRLHEAMTDLPVFEGRPLRPENYRKAPVLPKIEVHLEGMSDVDALSTMAVIECRMRWLPMDYETIHIVGLIANEPEAAFDFTQRRGTLDKRKTLIRDDSGCTEFGRQLEG